MASTENKFESFMDKVGSVLEKTANAIVNGAEENEVTIDSLIPPAYQATFNKILTAAVSQVASVDAKYTAIGQSTAPWGVKMAECVAVGGAGLIAIAAQGGLQIKNVAAVYDAAGTIFSNLNLATITETPVVPATSAA